MTDPVQTRRLPDVDHLTRDYRGLREQLIQLVARSGSPWTERSAADVGMTILEIVAYSLDHLAYAGDRAASEGFLRTARSRQSVRLHAALGDYALDRGATSRGFQHFAVRDGALRLPALFPVGPQLAADQQPEERDVFETEEAAVVSARLNRFTLRSSVAAGGTVLWLGGVGREPLDLWALGLRPGMRLALTSRDRTEIVQIAGVQSGAVLLARPCRASFAAGGSDRAAYVLGNLVPIRRGQRTDWRLLGRGGATRAELPPSLYYRRRVALVQALAARLERHRDAWIGRSDVEAAWRGAQRSASLAVCRLRTSTADALSEALADRLDELLAEAAEALRSALASLGLAVPGELAASRFVALPRQRLELPREAPPLWLDGRTTLEVTTLVGGRTSAWTEVDDLLRSGPNERHYVVEIAGERDVALRFGDGERGAMPPPGAPILARWVVGDPALGDVGRGALNRALGPERERLDADAPTYNPLATAGARPPEPLGRVADRLRQNLAVPVVPVTAADYVELLEQRPEVLEAAVLGVAGRVVRVAVRLVDEADPAVVPALARWCDEARLAGTCVRLSLARPLYVSVAATVLVHPEAEPSTVRARCTAALRELFGADDRRRMGVACTRGELQRALERVTGVEWSELFRFDRAAVHSAVVRDVVAPAADQVLRCLDDPEIDATGRVQIVIAREYGLRVTLLYTDVDLVPPEDELHAALHAVLSGPTSRPVTERWDALTVDAIADVLAEPPFRGPAHTLRLEHLVHNDRSVRHVLLTHGEAPTLRSLQLVPRHVEELP